MIPLKLHLRNFLCYRDDLPTLDFSGIHVAVLSGENGAGKSALLDAITWALWGRSRARTDDDLVSLGRSEAEVDFEFRLERNTYRVIRKHTRKGRGRTWLELQISGEEGGWQPITGNSIRETQAKISELVKMDYETFINSAFIVQGRANEFTRKSPGERKRILAEILGLSYYDRLERRVKEEAQARQLERSRLEERLAELGGHLAAKPVRENEVKETEQRIALLETELAGAQSELSRWRERRLVLELRRDQLKDLEDQMDIAQAELERREDEIAEVRDRLAALEEMLARREEIMLGYDQLKAARKTNDDLVGKVSQLMRLTEERHRLDGAISRVRDSLVADQKAYIGVISRSGEATSHLAAQEKELRAIQAERLALTRQEEVLERLRRRRDGLCQELAELRTRSEKLEAEAIILESRNPALSEPSCPVCGRAVEDERRDRLQRELTREVLLKQEDRRHLNLKIGEVEDQIEEISGRFASRPAVWQRLLDLERRQAELEQIQAEAQRASGEHAAAQMKLVETGFRLAQGDFAREEQAALLEVLGQLDRLDYNGERHAAVREEIARLAPFEEDRRELEKTEQSLTSEVQDLHRALEARNWALDLLDDLLERKRALLVEVGEGDKLDRLIAELIAEVRKRQVGIDEARMAQGALRQRLEDCLQWEAERQVKLAEHRRLAEEESLYEELALAFGPRGVQAMIIEDAIPEIEHEANALLGRITDDRMRLTFETQRDAKRGGTVETLDIVIADELGPRNYELFSGGEAFRIDFAVRIALSKLLARRAGAKLQTLVLDEGFGTQDGSGRERLVEAIQAVQDDFAVILVVTHIDELKDFFPVRIEVFKTAGGSQIALS